MSRIPTHAFGYEFTHLPEFVRTDVESLDREGALYADHWIEELRDFRHVRIPLTAEEAKEYLRRSWGYELYLRAGSPKWARDVPGIDPDVAHDADTYEPETKDGVKIPSPYHCFAAFLGEHLEAVSCGMLPERRIVIELQGKESVLFTLSRAVQALTPTIRSFNSREKGQQPWKVSREDDVRDLLYVMLKPAVFDLVKEEATPSLAGTHKFVDLSSKASRLFIEVKWVGRKGQWKSILGQIQVDIQSYHTHDACETLVFVIVDAVRDIPDPRLLEREITGRQSLKGRTVDVRLYVVDP
jgi:REase_DpnII-MboI